MVTLQAAMMAMVLSSPGDVELLDFYADWCAPCRAMQPTIEALEAKGYAVKKVDVTQDHELAKKYNIQSVPCYVLLVDGKEVERVSGGTSFSRLERMFKTAASHAPANGEPPGVAAATPPTNVVSDPKVMPAILQQSYDTPANNANAMPPPGMPNFAGVQPPSGNIDPRANSFGSAIQDPQLIAVSVRLRVEDSVGHSCGSGTIIDARDGKALILTCGHLFRDSQGKGKIEVDLFGPYAGQKVEGRLESFDAGQRDIGLVSIRVPGPIAAARLAPPGYKTRKGDAVASVGCDNAADPSVRRSQITSINRYQGPSNLQVAGQPVEGRSGGGLFSAEGYVIGVCNARDPKDQEGLFAAMEPICAQLDQNGLAFVYQSPKGWESLPAMSPPNPIPTSAPGMPAEYPNANTSPNRWDTASASNSSVNPASFTAGNYSSMNPGEQAALDELRRHLRDGAEVVCVIRPRNAPGAKSEVVMIDKASPEFIRQLSSEAQPQEVVKRTSLEVARPRKKILEWSIPENGLKTAP